MHLQVVTQTHVPHSLGFLPKLPEVQKEGETSAVLQLPSSSDAFFPQEGTVC